MKRVGNRVFFACLSFVLLFSFVSAADNFASPVSAEVDSEYSSNYAAEKTFDGNTNTGWFSKYKPDYPVTLDLDFGESVLLSGFDLYIYSSYVPIQFGAYVSLDGDNWTLVLTNQTVSDGGQYVRFDFDESESLRYLRIEEYSTSRPVYAGAVYEVRGVLGGSEEEEIVCNDSDGGLNYSEKGYLWTSVNSGTKFEDYCLEGYEDQLIERHCLDYENSNNFTVQVTCANGCQGGICLEDKGLDYIIEQDFGSLDYKWKESLDEDSSIFDSLDFQGGERAKYTSSKGESLDIEIMEYSENISFALFHEHVKANYENIDYESMDNDNFSMADGAQVLVVESYEGNDEKITVIWTSENYFVFFDYTIGSSYSYGDAFLESVYAYLNKYKTSLVIDKDVYECSRDYDCPRDFESYCESDYELYTYVSYPECENSRCVVSSGYSNYEYCKHGCSDGACVEKVYPKRSLNECDDLIDFLKAPYSFEDDDGSVWYLSWNDSQIGDYYYIDGERYFADRYYVGFGYDRYDSDYEFEGWANFNYEAYSFQSNVSDIVEAALNERVSYQLCSPYSEDGAIYYLCGESALYELNEWDDYFDDYYRNRDYGSVIWTSGNNLFIYRMNYAEYKNYYDMYFDDDSERYFYDISQEINSVERKQEKTLSFLSKLADNEAERVDARDFYYDAPWIIRRQLEEDKGACSSDIQENEDTCVPYWECVVTPAVCPEHGYQTSKCVDTSGCFDTKESQQSCNPGICSGCTMNKWLGFGWSELYTKCMPYGARFDFEELMKGEDNIPGGVYSDFSDYMEVEILNDYSAKITINNSEYGYREYYAYENSELRLGFEEESESIFVKEIVYDENMEGNGEIIFTIADEYNAYCDYDGFIKEQKMRSYDGSWATCQNNFECSSNLCSSGECVELVDMLEDISGIKQVGIKVLCTLANLFGVQDYDSCIAENLGGTSAGSSGGSGGGSSGGSGGGSFGQY